MDAVALDRPGAQPPAGRADMAAPKVAPVVALVGTPNCGKTALFNALTGSRQKVANYPGVTVERKSGVLHTAAGREIRLLDLPGTYSLRARSPDEVVTRDIVLGRRPGEALPDLLLCVVDAANLRLGLRLALELRRTGRKLLLVLNMFDIATRRGVGIDIPALSAAIGMPVTTSVAVRRGGTAALRAAIDAALAAPAPAAADWSAPGAGELRAMQAEAGRILRATVRLPETPDTLTTRVDAVLLHPVAGLLVLLGILFVMFQAVFAWAQPFMDAISAGFDLLGQGLAAVLPPGLLLGFLQDGVISGVGGVIVFLPQILILFLFILLLEDLGYMARAAFLMDRIMGGAGLHGRAFIPLLSSFACAIPGIMATRVIDSRRDRLTTILVAPLMTCSARIPVYTLIIGAFVPNRQVWGVVGLQGLVMFGLYATGIISALAVSLVIRRVFWRGEAGEPFMLELPDYKLPRPRSILLGLLSRARMFLRRAGTTIFMMTMLIWVLCSLPVSAGPGPEITHSLAALLGRILEPLLAPVGFDWRIAVALVPGMAAREVVVAALGTVYAVQGGEEAGGAIAHALAANWSLATALALLAWYVFAPQCAATLAVIRREAGGRRWAWISFGYMLALAWLAAFATYHAAVAFGL
jgi:ferrous iron transport protein B